MPTHLSRDFGLIGANETLDTHSLRFYALCLMIGIGRTLYLLVPFRVRQFTSSAKREARMAGTSLPWYSRVAQRFGNWFVASVLSSENDKQFRHKKNM